MIRRINEFNCSLAIAGFKKVKIVDVASFFETVRQEVGNVQVQFFSADRIGGWKHLYFAGLNALNAFKNNRSFSRSLAVEILLYASAQRQIKRAVEILGIKPGMPRVAILLLAEEEEKVCATLKTISSIILAERDDSVVDFTDEKTETLKKIFNISDLELGSKMKKGEDEKEALLDLIIERVALLTTLH